MSKKDSYIVADLAAVVKEIDAEIPVGTNNQEIFNAFASIGYDRLYEFFKSKVPIPRPRPANKTAHLKQNIIELKEHIEKLEKRSKQENALIKILREEKAKLKEELEPYKSEAWVKASDHYNIQDQLEMALTGNKNLKEFADTKDRQVGELLTILKAVIQK